MNPLPIKVTGIKMCAPIIPSLKKQKARRQNNISTDNSSITLPKSSCSITSIPALSFMKVRNKRLPKSNINPMDNLGTCDVCNVTYGKSVKAYKLHISGKKHRKKAKKLELTNAACPMNRIMNPKKAKKSELTNAAARVLAAANKWIFNDTEPLQNNLPKVATDIPNKTDTATAELTKAAVNKWIFNDTDHLQNNLPNIATDISNKTDTATATVEVQKVINTNDSRQHKRKIDDFSFNFEDGNDHFAQDRDDGFNFNFDLNDLTHAQPPMKKRKTNYKEKYPTYCVPKPNES